MSRSFNGQLRLRLSPELREELAKEAFATAKPMNQLCVEAISIKWVLEKDPKWKKSFNKLLAHSKIQNVSFREEASKFIEPQKNSGDRR